MKRILTVAGVAAALFLFHGVRAETVILADGSRLEGQVQVAGGQVTIATREATLTLPVSRVMGIEAACAAPTPAAPQAAAPMAPAAPAAPVVPAVVQTSGPPPLARALATRTDVSFDGVSPDEAFDYVRQITGMNLVLSNDVRRDTTPVYLRLHDVTVATVLETLGDLNGYAYDQRHGEILVARMRATGPSLSLRSFNVRDLLVSTEDLGSNLSGNGNGGGGGSGVSLGTSSSSSSGSGRSQGASPQFGGSAGGGATPDSLFFRSQDLAQLIMQTCGDGTWAQAPTATR